ncbi:MAG: Type I restriction modification DNA specificity domain protein [Candidatus Argoarchaeum ethanivorans]|uniref:Type I restriction modification DNA specificity domain protein n=1 Tax=Candidatus Argoarchaeum ethanivorans TaxID=2608793 RepID=A0A811T3K4_9EURY|nr:MAG: Type I restriction modification DNA specificity domain protein [Candidatus Argoarchaeum ethanivorans]
MNPETFFDNFGLLADTPNGVQKLRVLILQLAFKGKLVNNRQKRNMADHGEDLLTGWQQRTIGDLSKVIMPGFACNKSFQMSDGHVHLRTHNIDTNGKLNFDLLVKIDHKKVDMKKAQIHKGDIIFNNTNSQELVGKTCIVDQNYFYGFSNHLTLIKVIDEVEPAYIVYYFNLLLHIGYFAELCNRWIGQAGINTKMLKSVLIPLPPLEEQKRIVAKADKLMALCDELEARQQKKQEARLHLNSASLDKLLTAHEPDEFAHHWQRICDNFDLLCGAPETVGELRKAILQLAVQGKLVPQDPNDEPAAALLEKIKAEKARLVKGGKIRKSKPLPPVKMDEILFEIPDSWKWIRLNQIGDWGAGATPNRKKSEYYGGSIRWLKSGELRDEYVSESDEKITESALKDCSLRVNKCGDVLIAMYGATIGKVAILEVEATTNQAVCACTCFAGFYNRYLFLLLRAYRQHFLNQGAGGAQPNISRIKIINTVAPLPPLTEQRRIVAKVDQLMALCDELETKLKQSQTDGANLMEAMVGELIGA